MPPLPITAYFELRLKNLRAFSPRVAELAEQIAAVQNSESLKIPAERQTVLLFDRLDEVALQVEGCAVRLETLLTSLMVLRVFTFEQVEVFVECAAVLGGSHSLRE